MRPFPMTPETWTIYISNKNQGTLYFYDCFVQLYHSILSTLNINVHAFRFGERIINV